MVKGPLNACYAFMSSTKSIEEPQILSEIVNNKETIILLNDSDLLNGNTNKLSAGCFMSISNAHKLKFSCSERAVHDAFVSYQTREA